MSPNIDPFWIAKIEAAEKISKTMKFIELNFEFWKRQPCAVISLVVNMADVISRMEVQKCSKHSKGNA